MYTQQWCMSYRFAASLRAGAYAPARKQNEIDALISKIYFWNETVHVSDSSSIHHQEFSNVHTAMAYVVQVC